MTAQFFSVYDAKGDYFLTPFTARTEEMAIRMLAAAAMEDNKDMNRFAADYTLFHIGIWHEQAGTVEMFDAAKNLGTALQARARYTEND